MEELIKVLFDICIKKEELILALIDETGSIHFGEGK